MDGSAFDSLARRLASTMNRRAATMGLALLGATFAASDADADPANTQKKKKKCAYKCGKACCKKSQVCSGGACVSARRCPSNSGIDGYCPKTATCCEESNANRSGGCCHKQNPSCCPNIEGCCPSNLPTCCADSKLCCAKGTSCCPGNAGGGCCPASSPVCCTGHGQGKYCCPAGTACCAAGCCDLPGLATDQASRQPVPRSEHRDMAARS
jgi:hypothetical protein